MNSEIMTILIPITSILLLALYAYLMRPQRLIVAEAGPTKEATHEQQESLRFYVPYEKIKLDDGHIIDTRDYLRVLVDGKCMKNRKIKNKSQVLVKKIDPKKDFREQVEINDILLIHLKDKNIYKLRILDKYSDSHQLVTYRYNKNSKIISSKKHKEEDVIGVVKYVIE